MYDETMYNYPAYIASDGYGHAYEDNGSSTLENFTIYYHRFPGFDGWVGN